MGLPSRRNAKGRPSDTKFLGAVDVKLLPSLVVRDVVHGYLDVRRHNSVPPTQRSFKFGPQHTSSFLLTEESQRCGLASAALKVPRRVGGESSHWQHSTCDMSFPLDQHELAGERTSALLFSVRPDLVLQ